MAEERPGQRRVMHAVIPAAGLGTRFLPATKATPKEMLPVVDKPAIQYVVEEAVAAGLANVLVVTGRNKRPLEDHFDRNYELESMLARKGDADRLQLVQHATSLAHLHFVRQGDPRGLGHAVSCARAHVGRSPFAVLLGDDLIDPRDPLLSTMISVFEATGQSVIALMEVPPKQIPLYGCAAVGPAPLAAAAASESRGSSCNAVAVTGLVEKPTVEEAPSNLAVIGRYVLHPRVFDVLEHTAPGRGGEIQLTDALATLAGLDPAEGGGVLGVIFRGRRYDTGDRLDYLKTVVTLACEREDLARPLLAWLTDFVASRADEDGQGSL
ncbi:MAG: UTP--glucose-1-phosphate uridylyltransferase [Actinobacteria bacterium 69-20]|nr:UTP--glucose-1-phosphate uridylyltransferase [Actinomycetota bacterium]OJV26288.1 MAG: UTP--glucose-1-phosphate uridylyltransferase [Actinobacteria bacterium 69-20]